jgi:hypothetical protein
MSQRPHSMLQLHMRPMQATAAAPRYSVASSSGKRACNICWPCKTLFLLLLLAGVIGLACARAAAQAGLEVVLLEQEASHGTATSSRHSEVIHAGIYYPAGELTSHGKAVNLLHYSYAYVECVSVHSCAAAVEYCIVAGRTSCCSSVLANKQLEAPTTCGTAQHAHPRGGSLWLAR